MILKKKKLNPNIHNDEVIIEAREDIADDVSRIVKKCMESVMGMIVPEVPSIVEPEIRETWGKPSDALPI